MEISCDILSTENVDETMGRSDLPPPSLELPNVPQIKHDLHYLSQDDDYGPDGYGPQFIAEETEIVAAEPHIKLENGILGDIVDYGHPDLDGDATQASHSIHSGHLPSTCSGVEQNQAESVSTVTIAGNKSDSLALQAPNDVSVPTTFLNGADQITSNISLVPVTAAVSVLLNNGQLQVITRLKENSRAVGTQGIPSHSGRVEPAASGFLNQIGQDWSKSDLKKAKDRVKKQQQRADPNYKQKEREKSLQRMRVRRLDPVYRSIERVKDRLRRKVSRQEHPEKRQAERERDKISKRMHRSKMHMIASPASTHLLGASMLGETLTDGADGSLIQLNGEVIVETNPYQGDSQQVADVYRELVVKGENLQCQDEDVPQHVVYTDDYPS